MGETNQRQYARVKTCNLISYTCIDAQGTMIKQGMGQALDISQNGLLLESGYPIESEYISLMSADPDDRLVNIVGKVAHTRRSRTGSYKIGIRFTGSHEENVQFATSLIKTFHYRRTKLAADTAAGAHAPVAE
jgi:c-di-GMP-binding flagellar brake protein YcgR